LAARVHTLDGVGLPASPFESVVAQLIDAQF
jgi:4-amino-4-deoxychorismate lyase